MKRLVNPRCSNRLTVPDMADDPASAILRADCDTHCQVHLLNFSDWLYLNSPMTLYMLPVTLLSFNTFTTLHEFTRTRPPICDP